MKKAGAVLCGVVAGVVLSAQNTVELLLPEQPAQSVRVLQSRTVRSGNRTFVFNRVERPVLALRSEAAVGASASVETLETLPLDEPERWVSRTFWGSVQGGVSELTWQDEAGQRRVVYSNVDFMVFVPWFDVRIDETLYSAAFFGMSDHGSELPAVADAALAAAVKGLVDEATPNYVPAQGLSEEEAELLDLLHAYYAANRDDLTRRAAEARVAAEQAQRAAEEESARPKTLVFSFWKSSPSSPASSQTEGGR